MKIKTKNGHDNSCTMSEGIANCKLQKLALKEGTIKHTHAESHCCKNN